MGRAPADGWAVPWDMRISREHCDIELKNNRLYVRCLDQARNPIYRLGEIAEQFTLHPGETFRIGLTTFRLNSASSDDWDRNRNFEFEVDQAEPEVMLAETDRVDGDVEQLRDEIASLRAQIQADAIAKRQAAERGQVAREEVRMLRRQLEALKDELIAAQREVERLQLEYDKDISGSKEFQALRAGVEKLKEKVQSGEFLPLPAAGDSRSDGGKPRENTASERPRNPQDPGDEKRKSDSTEVIDFPKGLEALRAKLAAEAKERNKRRESE